MNESRIPAYMHDSSDGMLIWFSEMAERGLLFHPDDAPDSIINVARQRICNDAEYAKLTGIMASMFAVHSDAVYGAAYPIFMRATGVMEGLNS